MKGREGCSFWLLGTHVTACQVPSCSQPSLSQVMGKNHEESQREIGDLFSKLNLRMEESQQQFRTMIETKKFNITKVVDDLSS